MKKGRSKKFLYCTHTLAEPNKEERIMSRNARLGQKDSMDTHTTQSVSSSDRTDSEYASFGSLNSSNISNVVGIGRIAPPRPGPGYKTLCNGRFTIMDTLGQGASGKVKRTYDNVAQEEIALKVMSRRLNDPKQSKEIHREVEALRALSHPNILSLKHYATDVQYPKVSGGTVSCVLLGMELADRGEVFDFIISTGALTETIARSYIRQLLSALKTCHSMGIYHRDLKPENLLLTSDFQLKVADFGYCAIKTAAESDQLLTTMCGTKAYMAPEVLANQPYRGAQIDIWSAGVVSFIMVTGRPPFEQARRSDWWFNAICDGFEARFWNAHKRSSPSPSESCKEFILCMLQPEADNRASLESILEMGWLHESPILSKEQLCNVMTLRKEEVDNIKEQALQRRMAQLAAYRAHIRGGAYDHMSEQHMVRRGSACALQDESMMRVMTTKESRGLGLNRNWLLEGDWMDAFQGKNRVEKVLAAITTVLQNSGLFETVKVVTGNRVKGTGVKSKGGVDVVVKLLRDEHASKIFVADVERIGDGAFEFREVNEKLQKGFDALNQAAGGGDMEEDLNEDEVCKPIDMI